MKTLYRHPPANERGSVAVECALILPIFAVMMMTMLFFALVFWHYTVAQKAAHDAARFLASASISEMRAVGGGVAVPIVSAAKNLVDQEIADLSPGNAVGTSVLCLVGAGTPYWDECFGFDTPRKIRVRVTMTLSDPFFESVSTRLIGSPIVFKAVSATEYVGN